MKLIAEKTGIENILWSGLSIIFYVKHNTGNEFNYTVSYDVTKISIYGIKLSFWPMN